MKLSIVIPTYTITKDLEYLAIRCIKSLELKTEDPYELIVCEDGGFISPELITMVDEYVYSLTNWGFTKNVNKGIRIASGEYIAIVNSDIDFQKGNIFDLCVPGKVTSPLTQNQEVPGLAGHFFVIPRTVLGERGLLDERLIMFCSDAEYEDRVKDIFQLVPSVEVYHNLNKTILAAKLFDGQQLKDDRKTYARIVRDKLLL